MQKELFKDLVLDAINALKIIARAPNGFAVTPKRKAVNITYSVTRFYPFLVSECALYGFSNNCYWK